jgi:hypothetical protein
MAKEYGLDIPVGRQTEALRCGAQFPLIAFSLL